MSEFFESSFAEATEKRRENATMTKHGLGSRIRDRLDKLQGIQEELTRIEGRLQNIIQVLISMSKVK